MTTAAAFASTSRHAPSEGHSDTGFAATEAWLACDAHVALDPEVARHHLIRWAHGDSHAMLSSGTLRAYHLLARELDELLASGQRSSARLLHARSAFRAALIEELRRRGIAARDGLPAELREGRALASQD